MDMSGLVVLVWLTFAALAMFVVLVICGVIAAFAGVQPWMLWAIAGAGVTGFGYSIISVK